MDFLYVGDNLVGDVLNGVLIALHGEDHCGIAPNQIDPESLVLGDEVFGLRLWLFLFLFLHLRLHPLVGLGYHRVRIGRRSRKRVDQLL